MKKLILIILTLILTTAAAVNAQTNKLESERVKNQGISFDKQINEIYNKIQKIVIDNKLIDVRHIKSLPYQTQLNFGPDIKNPEYIELTKHFYIKDVLFNGKYVGIQKKIMRIYVTGNSITKFESILKSKNYQNLETEEVVVTDPSPMSENTDDIIFSHTYNGRKLIVDKKFIDVKNTVADPLRNNIKVEFVIPNLTILSNSLIFIVESNKKGFKDSDKNMTDFLMKSTEY